MDMKKEFNTSLKGFSRLSFKERLQKLQSIGALKAEEVRYLLEGGLQEISLAEKFIENVIGYFQLPLGVATHFRINGRDYIIPMAVEESSIVAAASKTAKWVREQGHLSTRSLGKSSIGQIQIPKVKNFQALKEKISSCKGALIERANKEVVPGLAQRSGGVKDLRVYTVPYPEEFQDGEWKKGNKKGGERPSMAVVQVQVDTCDAMGANSINQVCEFLKPFIEDATGERVGLCILSNLTDSKLVEARVELQGIEASLGEKIMEASLFAREDPYRATTHNKGILNGIDGVLIATGNDWRAVEAACHAYASRSGQYRALSEWHWKKDGGAKEGILKGVLRAPVVTGTVGGVTALHPTAKLCLRLLGIDSASELSQIAVAVGLVQNLGALRALCTVGILKGHMRLHMDNMALSAGAKDAELPLLRKKLIQTTPCQLSHRRVREALEELRQQSFS